MKPVRRLREPFVEVLCTEGSTKKAPWRVHEASSKGPWGYYTMMLVIVLGQYYVLLALSY